METWVINFLVQVLNERNWQVGDEKSDEDDQNHFGDPPFVAFPSGFSLHLSSSPGVTLKSGRTRGGGGVSPVHAPGAMMAHALL